MPIKRSAGALICLLALADASVATGAPPPSRTFHPASSPRSPILDHADGVALSSQLGTKVAQVREDPEAPPPGDCLSDLASFRRRPRTGSLTHKHLQGQLRLRGGSDAEEPEEEPLEAWGAWLHDAEEGSLTLAWAVVSEASVYEVQLRKEGAEVIPPFGVVTGC